MDLDAWSVVRGDQSRLVQIEHLAHLVRDLKDVVAVARGKVCGITNPDQLVRIRRKRYAAAKRKTER